MTFFRTALFFLCLLMTASPLWALSSANIPLNSPVYLYLEKLSGFGLIRSDIRGLKPFSRAEVARLLMEAEANLKGANAPEFARELVTRLRELVPREAELRQAPEAAPLLDYNLLAGLRSRYVYLDGAPRDYNRTSRDPGHQSAFGFIGGEVRRVNANDVRSTGTEGTPLLENNNGMIHPAGSSGELRWAAEAHLAGRVSLLAEPSLFGSPDEARVTLNRGYLKFGGGGLELEAGRDENWFGQGYRGTTTLTNNARNFDLIKLSSPEPVDLTWLKRYVGDVKYTLFFSRFDETDRGTANHRQPWMVGFKLAVKPTENYEIGANFVRQFGGPGHQGTSDSIFGGSSNDHSNSIAGFDMRYRFPSLRNLEVHGEFSGEDNAGGVWPIVESYVAGFFIPCLTDSCRDDFRFEYFFGSVMLYTDWQYPRGYVYHNMTPGHSQGGAGVQEFCGRYSHWFGVRSNLALEYFYTERGRSYRVAGQVMESKHAGRASWSLPLPGGLDAKVTYGVEQISNLNLQSGVDRLNQLAVFDLSYRY